MAYSFRIKIGKGKKVGSGILPLTKSLLPIAFRTYKECIRQQYTSKYFSKRALGVISSHTTSKKLILRSYKLRLSLSFKRMIELLAYNGAIGMHPYIRARLEMYFYSNYKDVYE